MLTFLVGAGIISVILAVVLLLVALWPSRNRSLEEISLPLSPVLSEEKEMTQPETPATPVFPHYRVVFLVIADTRSPVFRNQRMVWDQYLHRNSQILVKFLYGSSGAPPYQPTHSDMIFSDIGETYIPGILQKTLAGYAALEQECTYDFVIRTNLGSFWDFDKLMHALDQLPKQSDIYAGLSGQISFKYISGAGFLLTPSLVRRLLADPPSSDETDDVAIGYKIVGDWGVDPIEALRADITGLVSLSKEQLRARVLEAINEGKYHYRIKSEEPRIEREALVYRILLEKIYRVEVSHLRFESEDPN